MSFRPQSAADHLRRLRRRRRRAFTLVELLAVMVVMAILASFGIVKYRDRQERMREAAAIMDLQGLAFTLNAMEDLPADLAAIGKGGMLDPWGRPYVYLRFDLSAKGDPPGARKDKSLHPINTRFDLYSMGPDGKSNLPLTSGASRDDIIVANDGNYVGRASGY